MSNENDNEKIIDDTDTRRGHPAGIAKFISPRMNRRFFIRVAIVALLATLFFGLVCVPSYIKGESMEPTYNRVGVNFCWRPTYWFSSPKRGDIAVIRYTGRKLYLKRVVGLPGDTVEFRNGKLLINGKMANEPYVKNSCDWYLPERVVRKGTIYVVGDNRSMPMQHHKFGAVNLKRLYGAPLW